MIVKLRDNRYWIHGTVAGKFLRLPLGTSNENAAKVTVDHIERAWAEGATSLRWPELKNILPPNSFDAVAKIGNYREPDPKPALHRRKPGTIWKGYSWPSWNCSFRPRTEPSQRGNVTSKRYAHSRGT